jgi:hypothetical protein
MPGLPEEVHHPEEHGTVPVEDAFGDGRENPVVDRVRSRCVYTGRSVWNTIDHDSELAVAEWSAGQQDARAVHGGVGPDPCTAGRTAGKCKK